MICSACSPTKCCDEPQTGGAIQVACPSCNENGCGHCDDLGFFKVDCCPQEFIGRDLIGFVKFCDFAKRGTMPIAGGMLDQTNWFIEAANCMIDEDRRVKSDQWKS